MTTVWELSRQSLVHETERARVHRVKALAEWQPRPKKQSGEWEREPSIEAGWARTDSCCATVPTPGRALALNDESCR